MDLGLDWETGLKAAGVLAGLGVSLLQLRNSNLRGRAHLKADLEILKALPRDHPHRAALEAHIEASVERLYVPRVKKLDLVLGILMTAGFGVWTYWLSRDGFSAWSLLTGLLALSGLGGIADSFETEKAKASQTRAKANPENA